MKYVTEFRDMKLAEKISGKIRKAGFREMQIMEVCGSHTHAIMKYNIEELLSPEITLVHGPGCPVCVTPAELIDKALNLARLENTILMTYGDMLRVPGSASSLMNIKAEGTDIRIIYSPLDAVQTARLEKKKNVILFAIGFETTAPANASAVLTASEWGLNNFFILSAQVLIPPAVEFILSADNIRLDGLLAPGHVCSITGYEWCEKISAEYKVPVTVTGFEPVDILEGLYITAEKVAGGKAGTVNQYRRIVKRKGNIKAQETINKVFTVTGREWRGMGFIPASGYALNDDYSRFDAEKVFNLPAEKFHGDKDCISGSILQGIKKPDDCVLFGNKCNPMHPVGAPMVSSEGACSVYYRYKRNKKMESELK